MEEASARPADEPPLSLQHVGHRVFGLSIRKRRKSQRNADLLSLVTDFEGALRFQGSRGYPYDGQVHLAMGRHVPPSPMGLSGPFGPPHYAPLLPHGPLCIGGRTHPRHDRIFAHPSRRLPSQDRQTELGEADGRLHDEALGSDHAPEDHTSDRRDLESGCVFTPLVFAARETFGLTRSSRFACLVSVAISEEDYPSLTPVPPLPSISSPSSSAGKRRRSPSPPNRPHNGVPASALRPTASQGGERASDTEDEEEPKPAAARSQRHRPSATSPSRPVDSSPPPSPSSRPNPSSKPAPKVKVEVEDEADAEARRRAAITRIVQDTKSTAVNPGTSVKAAGKRRRF